MYQFINLLIYIIIKISAHENFEGKHKPWGPQNHVLFQFFKNYWTGPKGFSPKFVWRIRAVSSSYIFHVRRNRRDSLYTKTPF